MSKFRVSRPRSASHESHFVEEITSQRSESVGRLIDIDKIEPNPHQPRKQFGDLSEMVASVKEKGILEPILVRSFEGKFQIIAGERRYQAAKLAGLHRLPCIEVDVDHRGMLEISLIENLQRKDLTAFEEAAALQSLVEQFRYTHDEIARKLAKSRTVVTEMLALNRMPEEIQERCRQADIVSKSMLLQVVRQETVDDMHGLPRPDRRGRVSREEAGASTGHRRRRAAGPSTSHSGTARETAPSSSACVPEAPGGAPGADRGLQQRPATPTRRGQQARSAEARGQAPANGNGAQARQGLAGSRTGAGRLSRLRLGRSLLFHLVWLT